MLGVATDRGGRTATPAPLLWRQRFHTRRPQAGRGLDADGIGKADFGDAVAEIGVVAVSRVGQCDFGVDPGRNGRTQLVKGKRLLMAALLGTSSAGLLPVRTAGASLPQWQPQWQPQSLGSRSLGNAGALMALSSGPGWWTPRFCLGRACASWRSSTGCVSA